MDEGTSRRKGKFIPSKQPISSRYRRFLPDEDTGAPPAKKIARSRFLIDRSWMYKHITTSGRMVDGFAEGCEAFLDFVYLDHPEVVDHGMIRCPSKHCQCIRSKKREQVKMCLLRNGFQANYLQWTQHGEPFILFQEDENVDSEDECDDEDHERGGNMHDMVLDAFDPTFEGEEIEEDPNMHAQTFYKLLKDAEEPLWDGCQDADDHEDEDEDHDIEEDNDATGVDHDGVAGTDEDDDDVEEDDYTRVNQNEDHVVVDRGGLEKSTTPGTSSSTISIAAADPFGRKRRPCKKFCGHAQWRKHPNEGLPKQLARYGKHHFYGGSVQTLMTCIFKSYHTRGAIYWSDWSEDDKELCWQKFKEYFFFYDDDSDEVVKDIFMKYGKANWHRWLYYAQKAAEDIDKNWLSNPNFPLPRCHVWLLEGEWKDLIAYWNSPKWKERAKKAKENREKNKRRLVPLCGSKPVEERMDTVAEDERSQLRALQIGHQRKNGEWTSELAETIYNEYGAACTAEADRLELEQGVRPTPSQVDPLLGIFGKVTGGPKKGRYVTLGRSYTPSTRSTASPEMARIQHELSASQKREELLHQRLQEVETAGIHREMELSAEIKAASIQREMELRAEMQASIAALGSQIALAQGRIDLPIV